MVKTCLLLSYFLYISLIENRIEKEVRLTINPSSGREKFNLCLKLL